MAIAFAADCVFAPPSECACALAVDRGGIIGCKGRFSYAPALALALVPSS